MYESYFGLSELPFELTANPKYLFLTERQREALSTLQYGLFSAKALTILVGEAGTGKTTLIRTALQSERCRDVRCVYLDNPVLGTDDFVRMLALRFDLGVDASGSKSLLLERLEVVLRERRSRGEITALVVDEAQSLSVALLEELRLLANIETPSQKLLPLVLAGQPALGERLEAPELRQLKQRVTLRCELAPFEVADTANYMASRIRTAGGIAARLFTQEAVILIHECSRGIPRSINVICDNALLSAMALARPCVDRANVVEVCRDLRLSGAGDIQAAAPVMTDRRSAARIWPERRNGWRIGSNTWPFPPVPLSLWCASEFVTLVRADSHRMSRIDKALRVWEKSAGLDRSDLEATRSSGRTSLGDYGRETLRSPEKPNLSEHPEAPRAIVSSRLPLRRSRSQGDPDLEARLVTDRLSAVSLEQYRRLAAALHEAQVESGLTTVMLTSAVPHEGKTLTTVNLALTLSESFARRVLLIDADLRSPTVHSLLNVANRRGLTEVLADERLELPLTNVSERLTVLTAGRPGPTPLAGLSSPRMGTLLEECARRFDWVILDTPPVGVLPDAQLVARLAGAVIVVIGAGSTPAAVVERTIAELGPECIIGTVLNRVERAEISEADYYERYQPSDKSDS